MHNKITCAEKAKPIDFDFYRSVIKNVHAVIRKEKNGGRKYGLTCGGFPSRSTFAMVFNRGSV